MLDLRETPSHQDVAGPSALGGMYSPEWELAADLGWEHVLVGDPLPSEFRSGHSDRVRHSGAVIMTRCAAESATRSKS
jgi:hypothetical protein